MDAAHMPTQREFCTAEKNPTAHTVSAVGDFERLPDAIDAIVV